jgi:hypothetical protein
MTGNRHRCDEKTGHENLLAIRERYEVCFLTGPELSAWTASSIIHRETRPQLSGRRQSVRPPAFIPTCLHPDVP